MRSMTLSLRAVLMSAVMSGIAFFAQGTPASESLNYKVMYKWGVVHKQAGHATLARKSNGNIVETSLVAASEKWADRFFKVRDTLIGRVERNGFRPVLYEKRSHEGGERKYDVVRYEYSGNSVVGNCTRRKWDKKGKQTTNETHRLQASGYTIDMLSSFYYMRDLPYEKWKAGHSESVNLFSGKRKERLTIKYLGKATVKVDKKEYECYHISFSFVDPDKPNTKSSDDMEAWISTAPDRIPIKLEGKLKVGKVHCLYVP